ncbi:MAG: hypothetical protein JXR15_19855 [Shimia sp.]|uniref:hypothetical protein n=1 Tax=Shimia sp. TaxID=1954381 RepID=UPI003B8C8EEB
MFWIDEAYCSDPITGGKLYANIGAGQRYIGVFQAPGSHPLRTIIRGNAFEGE